MATTPLVTQALLMTDAAFMSRTQMAILHMGSDIQREDPDTPNHINRIGLANMAFANPVTTAQLMYNYIIIQDQILEGAGNSSTIPDQTLLDTVNQVWDQAANQLYTPPSAPPVITNGAPLFTPPPPLPKM